VPSRHKNQIADWLALTFLKEFFYGVVGDKVPYHMGCTGGGVLAGFQIFLKFYLRYFLFFFKF